MPKNFTEIVLPVVSIESVWPSPDFERAHLSDSSKTPDSAEVYLRVNYRQNQDTGYYRVVPLNLLSMNTSKGVENEGSFTLNLDPTLVYLELDESRFSRLSSQMQRLVKTRQLSGSVQALDGVLTNFLRTSAPAQVAYRALVPAAAVQHIVSDQDTVTLWALRYPRALLSADEALNITAGSFDRRRVEDLLSLDENAAFEDALSAGFQPTGSLAGRARLVARLLDAQGWLRGSVRLGTNFRVGFASQGVLEAERTRFSEVTATVIPTEAMTTPAPPTQAPSPKAVAPTIPAPTPGQTVIKVNSPRELGLVLEKQALRTSTGRMTATPGVGGHRGYDFSPGAGNSDLGLPVYAASGGTVVKASADGPSQGGGANGGYGRTVWVRRGDLTVVYAHLHTVAVSVGQAVPRGTVLGTLGTSGNSTAAHLHLEVYRNGTSIAATPEAYTEAFRQLWSQDGDVAVSIPVEVTDYGTTRTTSTPYGGDTSGAVLAGEQVAQTGIEPLLGRALYEQLYSAALAESGASAGSSRVDETLRQLARGYYEHKGVGARQKTSPYRALARSFGSFAAFGNSQISPELAPYVPLASDTSGARTLALLVFLSYFADRPAELTATDEDDAAFRARFRAYLNETYGAARKREGVSGTSAVETQAVANLLGTILGPGGIVQEAYDRLATRGERGNIRDLGSGEVQGSRFVQRVQHGETPWLLFKGQVRSVDVSASVGDGTYQQSVSIQGVGMGAALRDHQVVFDELNRGRLAFMGLTQLTLMEKHPLAAIKTALNQFAPVRMMVRERGNDEIERMLDEDKSTLPPESESYRYALNAGNVIGPYIGAPVELFQVFTPRHFTSTRYLSALTAPFDKLRVASNAVISNAFTFSTGSLLEQLKRYLGSAMHTLFVDELGYLRFRYEVEAWDRVPDGLSGPILTDHELESLDWNWSADKIYTVVDVSPNGLSASSPTVGSVSYARSMPLPVSETSLEAKVLSLDQVQGDPTHVAKTLANLYEALLPLLADLSAQLPSRGGARWDPAVLAPSEAALTNRYRALDARSRPELSRVNAQLSELGLQGLVEPGLADVGVQASFADLVRYVVTPNLPAPTQASPGMFALGAALDLEVDAASGRSLRATLCMRLIKAVRAKNPAVGEGHVLARLVAHLKALDPSNASVGEDGNLQALLTLCATLLGLGVSPALLRGCRVVARSGSRVNNVVWAAVSGHDFIFMDAQRTALKRSRDGKYSYSQALSLGRLPLSSLKVQRRAPHKVSVPLFKYGARKIDLTDIYAVNDNRITGYRAEHFRRAYERAMLRVSARATLTTPLTAGSTALVVSRKHDFIHDVYVTRGVVNFYTQVLARHGRDQKALLQYVGFNPLFLRGLTFGERAFEVQVDRDLVRYDDGLNLPGLRRFEDLVAYAKAMFKRLGAAVGNGPVPLSSVVPTYGVYASGNAQVTTLLDALLKFGSLGTADSEKQVFAARDALVTQLSEATGGGAAQAQAHLRNVLSPQTGFAAQMYVEQVSHTVEFGGSATTSLSGGYGKPVLLITLPTVKDGVVVGEIPLMWFNLRPSVSWFDESGAGNDLMTADNPAGAFVRDCREAEMAYTHSQLRFSGKGVLDVLRTLYVHDLDGVRATLGAVTTDPVRVAEPSVAPKLNLGSGLSQAAQQSARQAAKPAAPVAQPTEAPAPAKPAAPAPAQAPAPAAPAAPADRTEAEQRAQARAPLMNVTGITATAYTSAVAETDSRPNETATGTTTGPGTLAVSRDLLSIIPYGSVVRLRVTGAPASIKRMVEGRLFYVEDTMAARWTRKVDVWFPERSAALSWGNRQVTIEVVSLGKAGTPGILLARRNAQQR
jgi:murein DD-endopeptidase MepM/ murein hydrolase activator NlpD/3D (Asp-Asp-Asp) domain-containing protein